MVDLTGLAVVDVAVNLRAPCALLKEHWARNSENKGQEFSVHTHHGREGKKAPAVSRTLPVNARWRIGARGLGIDDANVVIGMHDRRRKRALQPLR